MKTQDITELLNLDESAYKTNNISKELLLTVDEILKSNSEKISEEVFGIYKKFVSMKQNAPDSMKSELFRVMKNFTSEKKQNNELIDALLICRFLMVKSELQAQTFYDIAEILISYDKKQHACEFIKLYEQHETNKPLRLLTVGNFYNLQLKDFKSAIKYYEQYLKIDETKSVIYTILASLYAKEYGDFSLKDQIYYFEKAYKLKPKERLILHSLAFDYEKLGDRIKADKFYRELLENNPTPTDYYNYGAFLINCGDFENGHKYFTYRFQTGSIDLQYPLTNDINRKWDFKTDISDKILLVHYEQGFGDTFMYCRFLPELKNLAKKVIFVVQEELYDIIKSSKIISDGIEVVCDIPSKSEYDLHMALLDAPYALKTNAAKLPLCNQYLEVPENLVKEYEKKYIKQSKKLKVGISYHGNKTSNYMGRDIDFNRFKKLFKIENIDFYSFSLDEENESEITSLGHTFKNFTDTACALKNMDLIISTDNVILNLAGALGVTTFGIFNKNPNFRWFKLSGDTGWYKSVTPLQAEENNCWAPIFSELVNILSNTTNKKYF